MAKSASEIEFASYLDDQHFVYAIDYHIGPGDFDFRLESRYGPIYCDVKEIRDSDISQAGSINAHFHLRSDIRKLRKKYKGKRLNGPVVLVTMNFSSTFFTGLTVVRALIGDVGIAYDKTTLQTIKPLHHIQQGNAVFTKEQNTSVSGVFVFDRASSRHVFFENPYTDVPMPKDVFHELKFIIPSRNAAMRDLINLGEIMFLNVL